MFFKKRFFKKSIFIVVFFILLCFLLNKKKVEYNKKKNYLGLIQKESITTTKPKREKNLKVQQVPTLRIVVVNDFDEKPLEDATVKIIQVKEEDKKERIQSKKTSAKGYADFQFVPSSELKILVHADGFMSKQVSFSVKNSEGDNYNFEVSALEPVVDVCIYKGIRRTIIQFVLRGSVTLRGRVVDRAGQPCEGLQVAVVATDKIPNPLEVRDELKKKNPYLYQRILRYALLKGREFRSASLSEEDALKFWLLGITINKSSFRSIFKDFRGKMRGGILYTIINLLKGYSVFTDKYHDVQQTKKIVKSDNNGEFVVTNIMPSKRMKITIFGNTTARERIMPFEDEMIFEKPGNYNTEFEIQKGSTVVCNLEIEDWEFNKKDRISTSFRILTGEHKGMGYSSSALVEPLEQPQIIIGPFFFSGELKLIATFIPSRSYSKRGWVSKMIKTTFQPGLNYYDLTLIPYDRKPIAKKSIGTVKITVVDESGQSMGSRIFCNRVRGYIVDKDGYCINGDRYREVNGDGCFEYPISEDGPYSITIEADGAIHEEKNVLFSPGDEYQFVFPQEKLNDKGTVKVSVIDENGKPFNNVEVLFFRKGINNRFKSVSGGPVITFKYLEKGEYKLVTSVLYSKIITPVKYVNVKANKEEHVEIRGYATSSVIGCVLGYLENKSKIRVFLSGTTLSGDEYTTTTLCDKDGKFKFKNVVPLGDFQFVATSANGIFGPFHQLVDKIDHTYEIELEFQEICNKVQYELTKQESSKEYYCLSTVEVYSEENVLYWKDFSHISFDYQSTKKDFITFLPPGNYKVKYSIAGFDKENNSFSPPCLSKETTIEVKQEPLTVLLD